MNEELFLKGDEGLRFAMAHFGVDEALLRRTLALALKRGAHYADLFFEHSFRNRTDLRDGQVKAVGATVDYGVGVRALSCDRTGYAYTEVVSDERLAEAAHAAAHIAAGMATTHAPAPIAALPQKSTGLYDVRRTWEDVGVEEKMAILQSLNDKIFSLDGRTHKVRASLSDSSSIILFCNSLGEAFYDYRPMVALSVTCVMQSGGRTESAVAGRSFRMGMDADTLQALVEEVAQEVVARTAILFEAVRPRGGEMPVVMGAGASGILLHEAIGHAFEADFNRKNVSIFSEMLGKRICGKGIHVVDDGLITANRGAVNFDDEGTAGQRTSIVTDGILSSFLHDRISATHYGVMPTGNGRRESFRHIPLPRMRATYMEGGAYSEEEIIASVRKGIYAANFSNGQVQIGAGDFTFFVKSGFLIEEGKLTRPVKDINIIGNGPQALADITMVGNNYRMDNGTWTCGKDGQSCPVTCGMPSALVRKLTVGGEN
ncbi:MAG: TldD/PmbA family protein [Tannerellaceae bacterium]|jgi:TldD protein|nr:TldD/PmbA family protein [Tannerellaceae bacterium]